MASKFRNKTDDRYETIRLTKEGKILLEEELESLKLEFKNLLAAKGSAFEGAVGDSWHDNTEYEHIQAKLEPVMNRIEYLTEKLRHVDTIEIDNLEVSDDIININDYVKINCIYDEDDIEELIIKLVAAKNSSLTLEYEEVSITSPLGEAIFKKNVGESISYKVNENVFTADILAKAKTIEELVNQEKVKKLTNN